MRTPHRWLLTTATLLCFLLASVGQMQEQTPVVPDLFGLNLAQAVAALNRAGFALGSQTDEPWSDAAGIPPNSISTQSIPAGQPLTFGAAVDVTILRSPNTTLSYDDNDFTLINNTGADLNLNGLVFGVAEGPIPAAFAATRWPGGRLSAGGCAQVWSVIRSVPKDVEGCARINAWLTTNNAAEYFWTALTGASSFSIVQNGVERGRCPAAPAGTQPLRCDIYLPANANEGATPFIYFAYTPERLVVHNRSQDQFMPLTNAQVYNNNPNLTPVGQGINIGEPGYYRPINPLATVTQLAPNQCVLFTNSANPESLETPEPCDVIAQFDIDPNLIFWASNFDLVSVTDGQRRSCTGATAGRLTICVMPR
jgi:hypothetical protein